MKGYLTRVAIGIWAVRLVDYDWIGYVRHLCVLKCYILGKALPSLPSFDPETVLCTEEGDFFYKHIAYTCATVGSFTQASHAAL